MLFVIIYGLNPFVLLEAIGNAHNDIWVICFVLASLYFLLKKRKLLVSIIFLAIATTIKYFTILLLPFIIIYYYKKEHPIVRLKKCILYGAFFLICVLAIYVVIIQNFTFIDGMIKQQGKFAKSIALCIYMITESFSFMENYTKIALGIFVLFYSIQCINWLTEKNITWKKMMKTYNIILWIFLFLLITNFQPWYIMWLLPTFMWLNPFAMRNVLWLGLTSQFANTLFMLTGEDYRYGMIYTILMATGIVIVMIMQKIYQTEKRERLKIYKKERRKEIG